MSEVNTVFTPAMTRLDCFYLPDKGDFRGRERVVPDPVYDPDDSRLLD